MIHRWTLVHILKPRVYFIQRKSLRYVHERSLGVLRTLDLADNVVPLAEESEPLVQHGLLLVLQVIPLGHAVLRLERRSSQSARGVFAGENWMGALSSATLCRCTRPRNHVEVGSLPRY